MNIAPILKVIYLLFPFVLTSTCLFSQITTISRDWKFKTGDSIEWASSDYNHSNWDDLKAGLWLAHAGYDYSGIAWYRKKIFIPSEPIVDYQTGEVHLLYQVDYARCYYIKSTDDGESWSERSLAQTAGDIVHLLS